MESNAECNEEKQSEDGAGGCSETPPPAQSVHQERPVWSSGSLSLAQRLRLEVVHEDCRDELALVELGLSVQISRLQGPANAEEKSRLIKVRNDCQLLLQQISQLLSELKENKGLQEEEEQEDTDEKAGEELAELEEMQQKIIAEKMQELQDMDGVIAELKHQLYELSEKVYNKRRCLELSRKDRKEAKELHKTQVELLSKQLKETRAQEESLNFQKNLYREAQQRQEQWEQDAKRMLQEKEREFNNMGCRKTLNYDRLSELSRMIVEMQRVVIEDREEQERLQRLEELARMATKVQAWWRGCMVRRGLGKFGKKEEPKKGKKKKKGKK